MNRARDGDARTTARAGRRTARGAPSLPHVVSMIWRDGAFLHWPVDPAAIRPQVPDPLELDTRNGQAWLSVLPFVLTRAGIRGSPRALRFAFGELNVRTYVRHRGDPGLYFFSVDVGNRAVATAASRLTRLPCTHAAVHVDGTDDRIAFSSARASRSGRPLRFAATYEPTGPIFHAEPDSLAYWLTARKRLYAPSGRGMLTAEIAHAPWPLREADATIHENAAFAANDLPEPTAEPVAHYCDELRLTGSIPRRI